MSYTITRHGEALIWVKVHGRMSLEYAEQYYREMWHTLDTSPPATDLLVDGRRLHSADHRARRRTEQIAHHPHLGKIAFVVAEHHLLLFGPLVHLVSGVGLFGDEDAALAYLQRMRGDRARLDPRSIEVDPLVEQPSQHYDAPTPRRRSFTEMMNDWSRQISDLGK